MTTPSASPSPPASVLDQLLYQRGSGWYPLPPWCRFYIDLGAAIARQPSTESRIVAGLAIPTRAFAAPFAAFGIAFATARAQSHPGDFQAHFDHLSGQPNGTQVSYLTPDGGKRRRGVFRGRVTREGCPMLRIHLGNTICYLPPAQSLRIQLAAADDTALPPGGGWRKAQAGTKFAGSVLGDAVHQFVGRSELDCAMVGVGTVLRHELTRVRIAVPRASGAPISGVLQEVVRVRDFARSGDTYRSDFLATTGRHRPPAPGEPLPIVAVFDGGSAFMRWRHLWPHSHAIVLLDRTGQNFDLAVQQLNREAVRPGTVISELPDLPALPTGSELLAYREPLS